MEVLGNYNMLGNILSFLNPFEILSSIQLVNHLFNHTSKTYLVIENTFSDMISDIFWIHGSAIENPGIKIITGLFNKIWKNKRLISKLIKCTKCGRFISLGSYKESNIHKFSSQITPNGIIKHETHQKINLFACDQWFMLIIGDVNNHNCLNMKFKDEAPSRENNEWFNNELNKSAIIPLVPFIRKVSECERRYNDWFIPGIEASVYGGNNIKIGMHLNFIDIRPKVLMNIIFEKIQKKCIELKEKFGELYRFKSRRKFLLMAIEFIQILIKSGIIVSARRGNDSLIVHENTHEISQRFTSDMHYLFFHLEISDKYMIKYMKYMN